MRGEGGVGPSWSSSENNKLLLKITTNFNKIIIIFRYVLYLNCYPDRILLGVI